MPYPSEHSARLKAPGTFDKFRRQNDAGGSGVDFIFGIKNGKSEIQAIRFDANKFTTAEAHAWLTKNDKHPISFEPAKPKPAEAKHEEGPAAPPGASNLTVPVALRDLSLQYQQSGIAPEEIEKGAQHELEHTPDLKIARKIAMDHLLEDPQYYTKLEGIMDHEEDDEDEDNYSEEILVDKLCYASAISHKEFDDDYELGYNPGDGSLTVEAFKSGTHTSAEGDVTTFTDADLEEIVQRYNQNPGNAPVCAGHPSDSSPAYGWIDKVKKVGNTLLAKIKDINPDFMEALKNKTYRKVSLSLYSDDKGYNIRHLAMLGGMAPAVKGLAPVSFAEAVNYKSYSFDEEITMDKPVVNKVDALEKENNFFKKLFNKFKIEVNSFTEDKMADTKVLEHAEGDAADAGTAKINKLEDPDQPKGDKVASQAELTAKETVDTAPVKMATMENVNDKNAENAKLSAEKDELKKQVEALTKELEGLKSLLTKEKVSSDADFCESLIKEGKLRPADKDMTILTLHTYRDVDKALNFAEESPESKLKKYRDHLINSPKVVEFGEFPNVPNITSGVAMEANPKDMAEMQKYIETKVKDKLALPTKTSYSWADAWKESLAECSKEMPDMYAKYVGCMIPGRG